MFLRCTECGAPRSEHRAGACPVPPVGSAGTNGKGKGKPVRKAEPRQAKPRKRKGQP